VKIALLTLHSPCNFGSNLQALSLVRFIEAMGHSVVLLDYRAPDDCEYYKKITPEAQYFAHNEFLESNLPLSPRLKTDADLIEYTRDVLPDCIVVGSDAVLRVVHHPAKRTVHRFGNPFWLGWIDKTPDLSIIPTAFLSVSSMGSPYFKLPKNIQGEMVRSLLNRRFISVRDYWTQWMIYYINFRAGIKTTLSDDPVLLLPETVDMSEISLNKYSLPKDYILFCGGRFYSHQRKWIAEFRRIAHRKGLLVLELPTPEYWSQKVPLDYSFPEGLSPLEWLKIIGNSRGYVGIRFHPIVVSIVQKIPFFSIDDYGYSMLSTLGMNFPSKTFDLCYRSKNRKYVSGPNAFFSHSPQEILDSLLSYRCSREFFFAAKNNLKHTIVQMLDALAV